MRLTEICIQRPVLASVLSIVFVIIGAVVFNRLQVRHYPRVDFPQISVITHFEGASPDIVETQVTKHVEDALKSIEGIDSMTSKSIAEESKVFLTFKPDRSMDGAANDVRDRIGRIGSKIPQDAERPQIRKANAEAAPMMNLVLYSDAHNIKDVADYAFKHLESQLAVVGGVANVDIVGGGEYKMYVRLDPAKLAAYQLNAEDVSQAIKKQNVQKPAGHFITRDRDIIVTTKAPLLTEAEFSDVVIEEREGYLVRVSDVAKVKFDAVEDVSRVRFNGHDAVVLSIIRQSVANPLDISKAVTKMLPDIRQTLPTGMNIEVASDDSIFIDKSVDEVFKAIRDATILVILVIFLFLRSFRAALIPVVTIPLSLIGTFALMYMMGFSINVLTLLGLVMAIGLVVDDAIVVLENIYRHIEEGMSPMAATFKGSKEISFAIIAMTITLAAVYAPIALSTGMTGKIFTEFALTLVGAVILSGFIALTLTPMMCGRLLKEHKVKISTAEKEHHPIIVWFKSADIWIDQFLQKIDAKYAQSLRDFLTKKITVSIPYLGKKFTVLSRAMVVFVGLGVAIVGGIVGLTMKRDLSPDEDQGYVKVYAFPPLGANLRYIDKYMLQAEAKLEAIPEVDRSLSFVQSRGGDTTIQIYLVPWEKRKRSSQKVAAALRPQFEDITGLTFGVIGRGRSLVTAPGRKPIEVVLQTTQSYDALQEIAREFGADMRKVPGVGEIYETTSNEEIQYAVKIDREKAAALNISVEEIGQMLDTLISGRPASHTEWESRRYQVIVELEEQFRRTQDDISALYIRSGKDRRTPTMIPLSEVVMIEKQTVPVEIAHTSGLRSVTLEADLRPGYSLGQVLNVIKTLPLPEGSRIEFSGESKRFFEESANILLIFGLAILSIYLVLSAQYESFLDPLIIMVSVPLSLVGGIFLLKFAGGSFAWDGWLPTFTAGTLTIFGQIGLITLIGLITKHGILIVDFANKLLVEKNNDRFEAVIDASLLRLRPILMTTLAMTLGAFPLALASGAGFESRRQIGLVIVGGMSLGTLFTLFVVPAVYTYCSYDNFAKLFAHLKSLATMVPSLFEGRKKQPRGPATPKT